RDPSRLLQCHVRLQAHCRDHFSLAGDGQELFLLHVLRTSPLDPWHFTDVNDSFGMIDNSRQPDDADIITLTGIDQYDPGCTLVFTRRIEPPSLHINTDLLPLFKIMGGDSGPGRNLLNNIPSDMPGVRFKSFCMVKNPFDAGPGHIVTSSPVRSNHAIIDEFSDVL